MSRPFPLLMLAIARLATPAPPEVTAAPAGPYRVERNQLFDAAGHPYLIRGTRLPVVPPPSVDISGLAPSFGAWSATTLITIRQRLNMNAVRLPVLPQAYLADAAYRGRVREIAETANALELLVIVEGDSGETAFWSRCAADFRDRPNTMFAVDGAASTQAIVAAIRAAGACQPVIAVGVPHDSPALDPNLVYEIRAHFSGIRTVRDRGALFESAAKSAPVLVDGLDPELGADSEECRSFPDDPGAASALVEENLNYFDEHSISWTISSFEPGRLITDYRFYNGTKLDDGWQCGRPSDVPVGLGLLLLAHLWGAPDTHGLFVVNATRGGIELPRGGIAAAYGPILADREVGATTRPLPFSLANIAVRVTDSHGVSRLARLLYTGAGWAFTSFIVPPGSALGPATIEIVRSDGSRSATRAIVVDIAPGIFTATADGRGPATGEAFPGGPIWACKAGACRTVPIRLVPGVSTKVRIVGTGFRNAGPNPVLKAWAGKVPVRVVAFGSIPEHGTDQLTLAIPPNLAGAGETDLFFTVNGVLSNVARIHFK